MIVDFDTWYKAEYTGQSFEERHMGPNMHVIEGLKALVVELKAYTEWGLREIEARAMGHVKQ